MTQKDRDRLVTLRKAQKREMTQREAAEELKVSVRQVRRLLKALQKRGDAAVRHGLRGRVSNRKIVDSVRQKAVEILSGQEYRGFGPTLASEYLSRRHGIEVSRETVRSWMRAAGLWRSRKHRVKQIHVWRPRRSRFGELVQWDTSEHDWLEGRGPKLYLIGMIDDATSRALAQFAESDSTEANLGMLESWLRRWGRPLCFYTDRAGLFETTPRTRRDEHGRAKDRDPLPPTQITRALGELNIARASALSPQAKGRMERFFETAQDRLVKGLRLAGAKTIEQANAYLQQEYLDWWEQTCTVVPAHPGDAHRPLEPRHELEAILSRVEYRQVKNDYTVQLDGHTYALHRADIVTGLRGAKVRVEQRRDGTLAIRYQQRYLRYVVCEQPVRVNSSPPPGVKRKPRARRKSTWMKDFFQKPAPTLRQAIGISNATS